MAGAQLPLERHDARAQLLGGDPHLHHRDLEQRADDPGLQPAGDDQLTPLGLQGAGPVRRWYRWVAYSTHIAWMWSYPSSMGRAISRISRYGDQDRYFCHARVTPSGENPLSSVVRPRRALSSTEQKKPGLRPAFPTLEVPSTGIVKLAVSAADLDAGQLLVVVGRCSCGRAGPRRCCAATAALPGPRRSWAPGSPPYGRSPGRCSGP